MTMKIQNTNLIEKRIVGITALIQKDHAQRQIAELWQHTAQTGVLRQDDTPVYAVYFGYQDKLAGEYRILIGYESTVPLSPGEEEVILPAGEFMEFIESGPMAETATVMWQHIWTKPWPEKGRRSFQVDCERYINKPGQSEVTIWLGLGDLSVES